MEKNWQFQNAILNDGELHIDLGMIERKKSLIEKSSSIIEE